MATPGTGSRAGSVVVKYLRTHPFSVALTALLIVTGLITGAFWGQFPTTWAAGPLATLDEGQWWSPLSALLVPNSVIELLLSAALALTVMAYAERIIGTVRTVWLFFATGVVAILIGIGVESLALTLGNLWAAELADEQVVDPAIGIVGVIFAASAFAPGLFRRRMRVIGFAALLMFALYAGDADSVYRLIAAGVGLVAGLFLARDHTHAPWRKSSVAESRVLIASIVAVTGLGPLIVLVSGIGNGPLSLAVAGFRPVNVEAVLARCEQSETTQCMIDTALALNQGAGPLLLSLMPLAISLVAAWGLRVGRRAAWILAICVNAIIAVLTAVSLLTLDAVDEHTVLDLDDEYVLAAWLAVLVPIAVIVLLVIARRRFAVRAPRRSVRQFALTVAGAFIVLAGAYFVIGLLTMDSDLVSADLLDLVADTGRRFLPAGLVVGLPATVVPTVPIAIFAHHWVGVIFWVVFIAAMIALYRATGSARDAAAEERFRALLRSGGGGTFGFMGTWPGNEYWFSPDGRGAVAYRVINGVALTMSDPVAAPDDAAATIRGFADYADSQGWTTVFYSFHEEHLPVFEEFGWQTMSVGEETVVPLADFTLTGKPWAKVRQAYNKGEREGLTTVWSTWDDLPAALAAEISAISEEWVSEKKLPEMGFTLGGMEELKDPEVALYLALNPEGDVEAITSWLPSWRDGRVTGWTLDFMRRGNESMPGVMEFLIASAAFKMREDGVEVLSLSGAPLAEKPTNGADAPEPTVMTALLGWLGRILEPAYGFTSLFKYKAKFNPEYRTIYMAYPDPVHLPTIGLAIGKAYLPNATPAEYLELVRTLTGAGT